MMAYVIQRTDGAFVADMRLSHGASYTRDLCRAAMFCTRESAERDLCPENERIVDAHSLLNKCKGE